MIVGILVMIDLKVGFGHIMLVGLDNFHRNTSLRPRIFLLV